MSDFEKARLSALYFVGLIIFSIAVGTFHRSEAIAFMILGGGFIMFAFTIGLLSYLGENNTGGRKTCSGGNPETEPLGTGGAHHAEEDKGYRPSLSDIVPDESAPGIPAPPEERWNPKKWWQS